MQKKDDIWPEVPDFDGDPTSLTPRRRRPVRPKQTETDEQALEIDESQVGRAFRSDLIRLVLPIRSVGEVSILICVILLFIGVPMLRFLSLFCCFNWILLLGILGCLISFFFNVLTSTAEGDNQLPYLSSLATTLLEDFWQGIIVPISNFLGSILYAFSPCMAVSIIYFIVTGRSLAFADLSLPLFFILLGTRQS